MLVIRNDGIGEIYPNDTNPDIFLKQNKETHFAVKIKNEFITNKVVFTEEVKGCHIVKSIDSTALLFTDDDTGLDDYPFYLTGYYGVNNLNRPITKIVTQSIITQLGNQFKIYKSKDIVKLLLVKSNTNIGINEIKYEAQIIGSMLRGIGLTAGLAITPTSVGVLV